MYAVWLFWRDRFKDIYFPGTDTWNVGINLSQAESGWPQDQALRFRYLNGQVYLSLPVGFSWPEGKGLESALSEARPGTFHTSYGDQVTVILSWLDEGCLCFSKYRLGSGRVTIGRGDHNTLCDPRSSVSGDHGTIQRHGDWAEYVDHSSNGTYMNGRMIRQNGIRLRFGDVLTLPSGLKIIYLDDILAVNHLKLISHVNLPGADASDIHPLTPQPGPLYQEYHRAPRMLKQPVVSEIELEPPMAKQNQHQPPAWLQIGPSATMVLPMVIGNLAVSAGMSGMARGLSGLAMIGTSSLLAVMWGSMNRRYRDRDEAETERRRVGMYQQYIREMEAELRALSQQEYDRLVETFPNVGQCARMPDELGNGQLWNRMPSHGDFLELRLGTGEVGFPGAIETQKQKLSIIDDPLRQEPERLKSVYSVIPDAPCTLPLRGERVVGILGGPEAVLFAQGLIMQIAALHSYHDVRIAVLTDEASASQWQWARWIPHLFASEDRDLRMLASTPGAIHSVMTHVADVLTMRRTLQRDLHMAGEEDEEDFDASALPLPHYVIFCTDPELLENEPICRQLLTSRLGTTLVCVAGSMELLPKECSLVLNVAARPGLLHEARGNVKKVDYEYPSRDMLQGFSRAMAPLRVRDSAESAAIPTLVSFLDVCGVRRAEELDVWRMWNENHVYEGICSTIGCAAGSHPFVLNISDKYHGPHGLIAGTTGSGKSVMIQTYILSLMLNYGPEQVQFILIDYKGGGMAGPFMSMPHVAGVIDNLQGPRIISRALASLNGEIHRRERIFKEHDVSSIDDYTQFFGSEPGEVKLPHLIIIVDEFAELKSEQPDFMRELVSASRVGRSLGIHLILATQKPSNSVSDEIWANARFHLCLRVQTPSDSNEMLKRPDAAYIKGMGRCFIQIGNDELFEQVQTSYSGLSYNPNEPRAEEMPHLLNETGQVVRVARRVRTPEEKRNEKTQMDAVLNRIMAVASEHGLDHARPLWLEELPGQIYFGHMAPYVDQVTRNGRYLNAPEHLTLLLGMADDVVAQRYFPCEVDLTLGRNLMIVGIAGTGKTTAVQSMVTSLCSRYDPDHLNIYIMSLTSQTLDRVASFPQVADVLFEGELLEQQRLINYLFEETQRRAKLFAGASTDSFVEYNRTMRRRGLPQVPAIVVFVDRFDQLKNNFINNDFYTSRIHKLIQTGSSQGVHFVVTALSKTEIPARLHAFFSGLALQLRERADYSDVLGKRVPFDRPPIAGYPGRALMLLGEDKEIYEVQIGLGGIMPERFEREEPFLNENPARYSIDTRLNERESLSPDDRAANIYAFGLKLRSQWTGALPPKVPRVKEKPTFEDFMAADGFDQLIRSDFSMPIGFDMLSGALASINLEKNYSMFVTGGKKSGVTNLLRVAARVLRMRGAEVHIIADDGWRQFAGEVGANLYLTEDDIIAFIDRFVQEVPAKRQPLKRAVKAQGRAALRRQALAFEPCAILIDDVNRLMKGFTLDRYTKSPVQLQQENLKAIEAAREAGEEPPALRTPEELAPKQNPRRTVPAKTYLEAVLSQMASIAEYYNVFLFVGLSQSERTYLNLEPVKTMIAQGRGIELGGRLNDYDPLNIGQSVPGWTLQERSRALDPGNGYMLTSEGTVTLRAPVMEEEEE